MGGNGERGIVLIMVMWVLTVLMVVVLSFSYMLRTEAHATLSFKEGMEQKFLAEAGIERGIVEILYRKSGSIAQEEKDATAWKIDGTVYTAEMKEGSFRVRILNESGKVDINSAHELLIRGLIAALGTQGEELDTVVDSLMDWKDNDNLHRLYGAEDEYYLSLPGPYKAKNANFESLEEMMLVKGVTPDLLYGNGDRKGLLQFITLNSGSSAININAAPREVLLAVPGMTAEMADAVLEYRASKEIKSVQEIKDLLGEQYNAMSPYLNTGEGNAYTVEAEGLKEGRKAGHAVKAVVVLEGDTYKFIYYKNPEEIRQWHVQ
ncbi:MAG: general secretion pathway protein GspK [Alphaproteobacteria bacterium]|uniref:General secretion pathway protein GspK n=1 Tax=Candidatus Nitrobium versatile TaxID=2884831 RepID=A0A953J950_9BACT|nr:general secretion pathway protein GspK [Candidatus Nitrobium versatile]